MCPISHTGERPIVDMETLDSEFKLEHAWFITLMKQCWATEASERPKFSQIVVLFNEHIENNNQKACSGVSDAGDNEGSYQFAS